MVAWPDARVAFDCGMRLMSMAPIPNARADASTSPSIRSRETFTLATYREMEKTDQEGNDGEVRTQACYRWRRVATRGGGVTETDDV